jgi:hypothetical protein
VSNIASGSEAKTRAATTEGKRRAQRKLLRTMGFLLKSGWQTDVTDED